MSSVWIRANRQFVLLLIFERKSAQKNNRPRSERTRIWNGYYAFTMQSYTANNKLKEVFVSTWFALMSYSQVYYTTNPTISQGIKKPTPAPTGMDLDMGTLIEYQRKTIISDLPFICYTHFQRRSYFYARLL